MSEIVPPKPDDLAVAFAAALMMAGKHETPGAAIYAAWAVVPEFYLARQMYAEKIAPMFFVSTTEHQESEGTEDFVFPAGGDEYAKFEEIEVRRVTAPDIGGSLP